MFHALKIYYFGRGGRSIDSILRAFPQRLPLLKAEALHLQLIGNWTPGPGHRTPALRDRTQELRMNLDFTRRRL
jgi:hypothetical protein